MNKHPNQNHASLPHYRLVVCGDGGVGKSALTIQFFQKMFVTDYDPTIEDSYIQHCEVDGILSVLDGIPFLFDPKSSFIQFLLDPIVLDTAGQEEFSAMREQYMRKGDGYLIVYSVTDVHSFDNVENFYIQILRVKDCESYPMLLVANKVDLVHLRKVSEEQGRELSQKLGLAYLETSAKLNSNVNSCFEEVVRIIRNHSTNETVNTRKKRRKKICCIM